MPNEESLRSRLCRSGNHQPRDSRLARDLFPREPPMKKPTFTCVKCERKHEAARMEYTFPVPLCHRCWETSGLAPRKPSEKRLHLVHVTVDGKPFQAVPHLAWDAREAMGWAKAYLKADVAELLGMLGTKGEIGFSIEGLETQLSIEDEAQAASKESAA